MARRPPKKILDEKFSYLAVDDNKISLAFRGVMMRGRGNYFYDSVRAKLARGKRSAEHLQKNKRAKRIYLGNYSLSFWLLRESTEAVARQKWQAQTYYVFSPNKQMRGKSGKSERVCAIYGVIFQLVFKS